MGRGRRKGVGRKVGSERVDLAFVLGSWSWLLLNISIFGLMPKSHFVLNSYEILFFMNIKEKFLCC
jgi:hypothetical protein